MANEVQSNITRVEAEARAALLRVNSYEIDIDVSSAVRDGAGDGFRCTTTVEFECREPGSPTWIDLLAEELVEATLNGRALQRDDWDGARLALPDLAEQNTLTVTARCAYSTTGEGLNRVVDPADGQVYLYTQCAAAEARRVFACFEQPDLKAAFTLHITAPADWTVLATSPTPEPTARADAMARWSFAPTPRLSTYLAAFSAGPFHAVRSTATTRAGELALGLFVRTSLAELLDADEILAVTRAGLAHFERSFDLPYPFAKYDQVFVPDCPFAAMENPGMVVFNEDHFIYRTPATEADHEERAVVILHEMSHMWFGNLVTMRWWNDLWLNESFAEWAGTAAAVEATEFTEAWTSFAQKRKMWAYQADQQPSTHPIFADVPDLDAMYANFDGITYAKGASVLRQLVAYVGREAFDAGIRQHLAAAAWGNATQAELLDALSESSGRDLGEWARAWLGNAGVTGAAVRAEVGPDGRYLAADLMQTTPTRPSGIAQVLRPMRIGVGVYRRGSAGLDGLDQRGGAGLDGLDQRAAGARTEPLVRTAHTEIDLPGALAELPELVGLPAGDLVVVNDADLSYVKARLDPTSLSTALGPGGVGSIAESLPRAQVWGMLWEQVRDADLPAQDFVRAAAVNLEQEARPKILDTVLRQAQSAVDRYADDTVRPGLAAEHCAAVERLLDAAEPGTDRQRLLALAFIAGAWRPEALERLDDLRVGDTELPGLPLDHELTWAIVVRLAATARLDEAAIAAHATADRSSRGEQAAARALAARPTPGAKDAAWSQVMQPGSTPSAVLGALAAGLNDPVTPPELLTPFVARYQDEIGGLFARVTPMQARSLATALFPPANEAVVTMADRLLAGDLPSGLRRVVVEGRAEALLTLGCRARSRAAQP